MKYTWLAAAVALAGWLIARRHKQKRWFQIVELVAIAVAVLIGVGVIHLPNFEKLLESLALLSRNFLPCLHSPTTACHALPKSLIFDNPNDN